jgi:hypothetical protein
MGPTTLLSLQRKSCYGFLSPLEIHCPGTDLKKRTLGTMASTLTTRPPRVTKNTTYKKQKVKGIGTLKNRNTHIKTDE